MTDEPVPAPAIAALPPSRPFVAPEELARSVGRTSLLRLGANESAYGPPPRALEAMRAELERTAWYGDPESRDVREALAARHGCDVENVVVRAGIDDLLGLAVRAYLAPGDVSVATLGTYPTYAYHLAGYGARAETVAYRDDGTINLDALVARARATNARHVYLANPDNPSGGFVAASDLAAFARALPPSALFVLDEAYADFVAQSELPPGGVLPRTVRMRTFSKAYGLAGARVGYCIAERSVVEAFAKIRLQFGALAALDETEFVAAVVRDVAAGRDEYRALAATLGIATLPSRTNFVCFDLGSRARAEAAVAALLDRGVFVRKPVAPPLDGFVRVTVGTSAERAIFAERFAEALGMLATNPVACP